MVYFLYAFVKFKSAVILATLDKWSIHIEQICQFALFQFCLYTKVGFVSCSV